MVLLTMLSCKTAIKLALCVLVLYTLKKKKSGYLLQNLEFTNSPELHRFHSFICFWSQCQSALDQWPYDGDVRVQSFLWCGTPPMSSLCSWQNVSHTSVGWLYLPDFAVISLLFLILSTWQPEGFPVLPTPVPKSFHLTQALPPPCCV